LQSQMDYIYFLCGLAFVLLAAVCLCARREDGRAPWRWLGLFALLQGASAWLDLLSIDCIDSAAFRAARLCVMAASFLCLVEFGRLGTKPLLGRWAGRWVTITLFAMGCTGYAWGLGGLSVTFSYCLGFTGATWSAVAMALAGRHAEDPRERKYFLAVAVLFIAYAVAGGLIAPKAHLLPAASTNQEAVFGIAGVYVQLLRGLIAAALAVRVWQVVHHKKQQAPPIYAVALCLTTVLVVAGGWWLTQRTSDVTRREMTDNLLSECQVLAAAIDPALLDGLADAVDGKDPRDLFLRTRFREIIAANAQYRFVYLMDEKDGRIVFTSDAEPRTSKDYTPVGTVYGEAPAELRGVFSNKTPATAEYRDRWGDWISAFVPIRDRAGNRIVAVLGIDRSRVPFYREVAHERLEPITITALIVAIIVAFYIVYEREMVSVARISESDGVSRAIGASAQDAIIMLDGAGNVTFWNESAERTFGYSQAEIVGRNLHDLLAPGRYLEAHHRAFGEFRHTGRGAAIGAVVELEAIRKDGTEFPIELSLSSVKIHGEWHAVGILRDVSARKQAEEALRASEDKFSKVFQSCPDPITIRTLADNRYLEVNSAFERFTGYSRDEMVGRTVHELGVWADEADLDESNRALLARHDLRNLQFTFRTKSGELRIGLLSAETLSVNGEMCALTAMKDITDLKETEMQLRASQEQLVEMWQRLDTTLSSIGDGVVSTDVEGGVDLLNAAAELLTGWSQMEAEGRPIEEVFAIVNQRTREPVECPVRTVLATGQAVELADETVLIAKDGTERSVADSCSPIRDAAGNLCGVVLVFRDVTERAKADAALRFERAQFISLLDAMTESVYVTDPQTYDLIYANSAAVNAHGRPLEGGKCYERLHGLESPCQFCTVSAVADNDGQPYHWENHNSLLDRDYAVIDRMIVWPDGRRVKLSFATDVTEHRAYEQQLDHIAHHDPLTGLPNRLLFADRLNHSLAQAKRAGTQIAVMFFDLDRFKLINDSLGHSVGDTILQQAAIRIKGALREADTVARMGGDEFTVVLSDISSAEDATRVARKALDALSRPFRVNQRELSVSASIGIGIYPSDGHDAESLVRNADAAMYLAKEQGKNTYRLYNQSLNASASHRMTLDQSLRQALKNGELRVHYQPRVAVSTGALVGAEALLRWQHPELGMVPPDQFITLAEETGMIDPITVWVLGEVCAQNRKWQEAGYPRIDIAVNVSPRQFDDDRLTAMVRCALKKSGLRAEYLSLEVTESSLMSNPDAGIRVMTAIRVLGVRIAIDDFGTGYSALSRLKQLPIDAVKIDRSLINDLTKSASDEAITSTILAIARSLGLSVIAEGVETMEQLRVLQELGCDEMQGYFVSHPVPADEFVQAVGWNGAAGLDHAA